VFQVEPITQVTLSGLTISNGSGGGILNSGYGATLTVSGCTLAGNSATDRGGIYNDYNATLTASGGTLSGNSATVGGGIDNEGTAAVSNSVFSGNTASDRGGGIFNGYYYSRYYDPTLTVSGCPFSGNSAVSPPPAVGAPPGYGGGIDNEGTATL